VFAPSTYSTNNTLSLFKANVYEERAPRTDNVVSTEEHRKEFVHGPSLVIKNAAQEKLSDNAI